MKEIALTGLDGSQLLGFLATLGVFEVLSETEPPGGTAPQLRWELRGSWHPVFRGPQSVEEIVQRVMADSTSALVDGVLAFRYLKVEKKGPKAVGALSPPVAVLRASLEEWQRRGQWSVANHLACLMCETASESLAADKVVKAEQLAAAGVAFDAQSDLSMAAMPTPFDFTSRNAQFLEQLAHIRNCLTTEIVAQDLVDGVGAECERVMRWDTLTDLPGAVFANVRPTPRPASEWLAFRGLALLPLFGVGKGIALPGFDGRRKAGQFSWVLWGGLLSRDVVRTTLAHAALITDGAERAARGCEAGFTVLLGKDATGYDGSVSPSTPLRG